ncbi:MAG: hypothetical protein J6X59_07645 [Bacteroidales bacterium]|nr:hypothetical protein [Bacteroidales bacterium]
MKKAILLVLSLIMSVTTFAQQQLATLNHNDSITVFYGVDALNQAHSAAVNGDIITLSSGVFNSFTITKAVTIRGAGAWTDSLGNQTTIRNNCWLDVSQDSLYHLTIEGIYFLNDVYVGSTGLYNPQFLKCYFDQKFYCRSTNEGLMQNAMFVNCYLDKWFASYDNGTNGAKNTQFVNSVIDESWDYSCPDIFVNCMVTQDPQAQFILKRVFQNCVLCYDFSSSICPSQNSYTAFNCIFIQWNTGISCGNLFSGHPNHTLWNMRGWNTVFKTDGYYELNDSIAATCLGLDGTQVGIYGGAMPFNPRVTNPIIKSINVATRSTADGKLPVNIEVVSDDE